MRKISQIIMCEFQHFIWKSLLSSKILSNFIKIDKINKSIIVFINNIIKILLI